VAALPRRDALDAVLFDAGGTLIELDYAFIAAQAELAGHRLETEALRRAEGLARREIDRIALQEGRLRGDDESRRPSYFAMLLAAAGLALRHRAPLVAELEEEHTRSNLWRVAVRGAHATLASLREQGLRLAVVSNADGRVARLLEEVGLAAQLELIVDSHWEGVEKPDPAIFDRALGRLGVRAERACYVGDIYAIDVRGARAAGLAPVLVDGVGAYSGLDCPHIASLDELRAALAAGGAPAPR
jgi:putative hydrolase of the HAD superfamily